MPASKELISPKEYSSLSAKEKKELNGCGPDGFLNRLIPDAILGTSVKASCNVHDFTFIKATNQKEHKKSDDEFLLNMLSEIESGKGSKFKKWIRKKMAHIYYAAVRAYSIVKGKKGAENDRKKI